jgi:hypothetical protein
MADCGITGTTPAYVACGNFSAPEPLYLQTSINNPVSLTCQPKTCSPSVTLAHVVCGTSRLQNHPFYSRKNSADQKMIQSNGSDSVLPTYIIGASIPVGDFLGEATLVDGASSLGAEEAVAEELFAGNVTAAETAASTSPEAFAAALDTAGGIAESQGLATGSMAASNAANIESMIAETLAEFPVEAPLAAEVTGVVELSTGGVAAAEGTLAVETAITTGAGVAGTGTAAGSGGTGLVVLGLGGWIAAGVIVTVVVVGGLIYLIKK